MKPNKPIAVSINFDSFNENVGFPKGYKDPCFFDIFDRFLAFSSEYGFHYSIYIIGKDLENPELAARVKDWSDLGHEISNHSYSHFLNLGSQKTEVIRSEILKAHELIHKCTGKEPSGFVCPGWSSSPKIINELIDANYLYDASLFPSYIIYPAILKNAVNHIFKPKKFLEILNRRDILYPYTKPLTPFFADRNFKVTTASNPNKIIELPLPTLNRRSLAIWHTLLFVFSEKKSIKRISQCLTNYEYFYYLMHPADLADIADTDRKFHYTIERLNVPLKKKNELFRKVFDLFVREKREFVTMEKLALRFKNERIVLKDKSKNNTIADTSLVV